MTDSFRRPLLCAALFVTATPAFALAQSASGEGGASADSVGEASGDPPGLLEGGGILVGDGITFHPTLELHGGYQSNVFFEDNNDRGNDGQIGSPIIRFAVGGGLGTRPLQRLEVEAGDSAPPSRKLALRGDVLLTWNQYLAEHWGVSEQSDLGVGLLLDAHFNPDAPLSVRVREGFTRAVTPPTALSIEGADRDKNDLVLGIVYKPGGGAIEGYAHYTFGVDLFERTSLQFSNRSSHMGTVGGRWQWLPKTQFNTEANVGLVSGTSLKSDSMPMRFWAGTSTLITPTVGLVLRGGYGMGNYTAGETFASYLAQAEGRIAVGPVLRLAFGYSHDFTDTLIANFYTDHAVYGRMSTQVAGRLQLRARGELRFRDYSGIPMTAQGVVFCSGGAASCSSSDRTDIVARVDTTLDYQLNPWLVLGGAFTLLSDTTDFFIVAGSQSDSAGFVWTEFLAKASAHF